MLSRREKSIIQSVELMFSGLDDDALKEVILATALQKSEEEKERIIEDIKKKKEEDMKYFNEKFELDKVEPININLHTMDSENVVLAKAEPGNVPSER
jgi:hypothetical protein